MDDDTVSVEDMADMHGVNIRSIRRILRADQKRKPEERVIPGAYKVGSKYRGEWRIPRKAAEAWKPYTRERTSD